VADNADEFPDDLSAKNPTEEIGGGSSLLNSRISCLNRKKNVSLTVGLKS
jgi:hypothetical protein